MTDNNTPAEILNPPELRQRLETIVSRISRLPVEEFQDDVLIREELGIDSLMAMEITAAIEREFTVEIDEGEIFDIRSVGEFSAFVDRRYRETYG
ncbi:MAG: acyl carrier protein [Spirochaeta sp.]|nr:acyl carrier protein [Spirochaeta sp.]